MVECCVSMCESLGLNGDYLTSEACCCALGGWENEFVVWRLRGVWIDWSSCLAGSVLCCSGFVDCWVLCHVGRKINVWWWCGIDSVSLSGDCLTTREACRLTTSKFSLLFYVWKACELICPVAWWHEAIILCRVWPTTTRFRTTKQLFSVKFDLRQHTPKRRSNYSLSILTCENTTAIKIGNFSVDLTPYLELRRRNALSICQW